VALYLASIADPRTHAAHRTERQIHQGTGVDRKSIRAALRSLTQRHLITRRLRKGSKSPVYLLNFTQTTVLPSGGAAPPLPPEETQQTLPLDPTMGAQRPQTSGPNLSLDKDDDSNPIIDRMLDALPADFSPNTLKEARE
jgi:hypothetical protein